MVPEVSKCNVTHCFYNRGEECHAHAVSIGSEGPECDTFANAMSHTDKHGASEVGACHQTDCGFNDEMFCHACSDISVGWSGGKALCETYRSK